MTDKRCWANLSTDDFRELDVSRAIAVLPVAAIEQHGPHLPVSVDRDIIEAVVEHTAPLLDDLEVLFLPTIAIGKSNEHIGYPGTLTFGAQTLIAMWMDIGASVHRAGVRKLMFINSHGGNVSVMDIVSRDLRARYGLCTAWCSWFNLYETAGLFDARELQHGVHGGFGETSIMLAIHPERVDMSKARDFYSTGEDWAQRFEHIGVGDGNAKLGWLIEDLNAEGACGNAAAARAEVGAKLLESGAAGFRDLLIEFDSLDADGLSRYPE